MLCEIHIYFGKTNFENFYKIGCFFFKLKTDSKKAGSPSKNSKSGSLSKEEEKVDMVEQIDVAALAVKLRTVYDQKKFGSRIVSTDKE